MQEKDNPTVFNEDSDIQMITPPQSVALCLSCLTKVLLAMWAHRQQGALLATSTLLQNTQSMLVYTTDDLSDTVNP